MREAIHRSFILRAVPPLLAVGLLLSSAGCGLDKAQKPDPTGPSDVGVSTDLVAAPDVLNADGVSESVIMLTLRDQDGKPISGRSVIFDTDGDGRLVPSTSSTFVGPVQTGIVMATGQSGTAYVVYVAGTAITTVHVYVRPYSIDTTYTPSYRSVEIIQR
jgi:hypothetical protein